MPGKKCNTLAIANERNYVALCLLLSFFIAALPAWSQPKTFRTYTVENGLISNSLEKIFQDADGFMWFGSSEGLSIYDGYKFNNYTAENNGLSDNSINSFFEKNNDEIWIIHSSGIDVFLKRRFVRTIPLKQLNTIIRTSEGKLIAAGEGGLYEIVDENRIVKRASSSHNLYNIYEVNGHFIVDLGDWSSTLLFDKSFELQDVSNIGGVVQKDNRQKFWLHGGLSGLFLIDTTSLSYGKLKLLPPPEELRSIAKQRVSYIFTDSDGSCWMSVYEKGIFRVDKDGHVSRFNELNGLNSNFTEFFFEDAEGNMWASGVGVTKFSEKEIEIFSKREGLLTDYISSVSIHRNAVWMAQVNGISCLYKNRIYNFPYSDTLACTWTSLLVTGDSLWTGNTSLSLFKIHYIPKPRLELLKRWPCYTNQFQLYTDGSLVLSNPFGFFQVTRNRQIQQIHSGSHFLRFVLDGDRIVAGGLDNEGISIWTIVPQNGKLTLSLEKQFSPIVANHIYSIVKGRDGEFWFGTANMGIMRLSRRDGTFVLRKFSRESGLLGNNIGRMLFASNNLLLAATSQGLFFSKLVDDSLHFEDADRKYGLLLQAFDIKESDGGELFLGTPTGLILFRKKIDRNPLPPKVYFTQVLHNNHLDTDTTPFAKTRTFAHTENNFSFEFVATSFRNEEQVLFSYALKKDNVQGPWSEPRKIHNLYFPDLSPGNYSLQVKALSVDDLWSAQPAEYNFIINAPFWKTWWFACLIFVAVAIGMAAVFWFRLLAMKRVLSLRTKISRDLHDEVGSTLSGISLFSAVAKKQLDNEQEMEARESLDRIILHCDDTLGKMSDIVWAINPENDSLEKMINRLKSFAISTAGSKNIQLHFDSAKDLNSYEMDMQRRKNIYLICKEAINNSIKYSMCENIYVSLCNDQNRIQINIRDDGKGFDVAREVAGNGLSNMRERAREIDAQIEIKSSKNEGTSLDLNLKFT
jgi:two-component sensor histidine kinase